MTNEERISLLRLLEESAARLESAVADLPPDVWTLKPDDGVWSPAEIVEHLILSEISALRVLTNVLPEAPRSERDPESARRFDAIIMARVPNRTPGRPRVPAPESVTPSGRWPDRDQAIAAFRESRSAVIQFVRTTDLPLRARVVPHPAFGVIDGYQWGLFVAGHCERHVKQLNETVTRPESATLGV